MQRLNIEGLTGASYELGTSLNEILGNKEKEPNAIKTMKIALSFYNDIVGGAPVRSSLQDRQTLVGKLLRKQHLLINKDVPASVGASFVKELIEVMHNDAKHNLAKYNFIQWTECFQKHADRHPIDDIEIDFRVTKNSPEYEIQKLLNLLGGKQTLITLAVIKHMYR